MMDAYAVMAREDDEACAVFQEVDDAVAFAALKNRPLRNTIHEKRYAVYPWTVDHETTFQVG